ncbi:MAG TPA: hypothetical protein VEJ23_06650 [Solirubrobacteraceae bacterium]|nr:hypothetical protein [Solirubrobacteraceae bacterium]
MKIKVALIPLIQFAPNLRTVWNHAGAFLRVQVSQEVEPPSARDVDRFFQWLMSDSLDWDAVERARTED